MRTFIKSVFPEQFHRLLYKTFIKHYKKSYSQSGEDMILNTIFSKLKKGVYVDIGANNPTMQSNTHFFYKKGWNGINIDALPGSMRKFKQYRRRDINLEIPISNSLEPLNYYMFSSSFLNTFSKEVADSKRDKLIQTKYIQTKKLSYVLNKYLNNREIDFMSIDVEGFEIEVLKSNDWNKYRPKIIVLELFANKEESNENFTLKTFLNRNDYFKICSTPTNAIFIDKEYCNIRFGDNSL